MGECDKRHYTKSEAKLRELLVDAIGTIEWMAGSKDFSPEGQAYQGWLKVLPLLEKFRQAVGMSSAN